jgi:hypothetical protein
MHFVLVLGLLGSNVENYRDLGRLKMGGGALSQIPNSVGHVESEFAAKADANFAFLRWHELQVLTLYRSY